MIYQIIYVRACSFGFEEFISNIMGFDQSICSFYMQARIQGGGGVVTPPPCSRPPIFFSTNFLTSKKKNQKKSLGIFYVP